MNRLNDFLSYLRLVHPPTIDCQLANWQRAKADAPLIYKSRDLADFLLQGFTDGPDHLDPTIDSFIGRLRHSGEGWRYSATGEE